MGTKITVLGSGAMATACSILLTERTDQHVTLWGRNAEHVRELAISRENRRLLPGVHIPDSVAITSDIDAAISGADYYVAAIPSKFLRSALEPFAGHIPVDRPVISVIKGLENCTLLRPSEVIAQVLGSRSVAALCGPSHAEEISRRLPASVVAASSDALLVREVQRMFNTERFRVYTNADILGVEIAGALKNVIAIAAGICDGQGFGDNAKSALVTRGLVEMTRFGATLGADPTTFSGLAGMGDLMTTCFSRHSRNRAVGERLGRGESLADILASVEGIAEGVTTTRSVHDLAAKKGIDMPITAEVFAVLFENRSPIEATKSLMLRPLRGE